MRKLILIKHASPQVDPRTPSERWRLSEAGRAKCAPLAERLRALEPTIIVSSVEPKAEESARLVAGALGVPHVTATGLHEHDRSNVPHLRSGEFISLMELLFRKPDERVLGRESASAASERFEQAVANVLEKHTEGNVAIVSHGTVIALFLANHGAVGKPFELWRRLGLPSVAVLSLPEMQVTEIVERIE